MNKSHQSNYDICVVGGLGHVGLPLALSFADAGKKTVAYDINEKTINQILKGKMPFMDEGADEVLNRVLNKTFFVSSSPQVMSQATFIVITLGTPVDEHLNPRFTDFIDFFEKNIDYFQDGQHVILRSTVFPGTTEKIDSYFKGKGKKVKISFCPERIAQGFAMEELRNLPEIVSAFDEKTKQEVKELFLNLTSEIVFLTPVEAELAKIFCNVWRYIQFATSNQFYQIALQNNVDFYKIYDAMTYKYPRAKSFPKAGFAAGPCLFKDTMQLAAFSNNTFFLGHSAMLVNEGIPNTVVQKLQEKYSLKGKTVGILGMAFKADNDDNRESLSYKLRKILIIEAEKVLCSDLYIKDESFVTTEDLIENSHIIILAAPHREYKNLQIPQDKILVDIWNFYGKGGLF